MKVNMFQYVAVKITQIDTKRGHFEGAGYIYVGELSPEEGSRHINTRSKMEETILCFLHPVG